MSENLDLVRSIYAAFERGDYSSADWADPQIEYVIADGPSPGTWSGLAGMAEAWREILSAWDDFKQAVEEYRELDPERVLVLVRNSGHGKTSGLELGQIAGSGAAVFEMRDGIVTRQVVYWDRDRALADLGLEG
jgi:ketosteroid isomerase-like protein